MDPVEQLRLVQEHCAHLKELAQAFEESDPRHRALRAAAFALLYAALHRQEEYAEFGRTSDSPLDPVQRQRLRDLGLQ